MNKFVSFLTPPGIEIEEVRSGWFCEEQDQWMPGYRIIYSDGHKSGTVSDLAEAIVMARGEYADALRQDELGKKTCKFCGEDSGEYDICKECFQLCPKCAEIAVNCKCNDGELIRS